MNEHRIRRLEHFRQGSAAPRRVTGAAATLADAQLAAGTFGARIAVEREAAEARIMACRDVMRMGGPDDAVTEGACPRAQDTAVVLPTAAACRPLVAPQSAGDSADSVTARGAARVEEKLRRAAMWLTAVMASRFATLASVTCRRNRAAARLRTALMPTVLRRVAAKTRQRRRVVLADDVPNRYAVLRPALAAHWPLFALLTPAARDDIVRAAECLVFEAREQIWRRGEPGSTTYVVDSGLVDIADGTGNGATLTDGALVGRTPFGLLESLPTSAFAVSERVVCWRLTADLVSGVLRDHYSNLETLMTSSAMALSMGLDAMTASSSAAGPGRGAAPGALLIPLDAADEAPRMGASGTLHEASVANATHVLPAVEGDDLSPRGTGGDFTQWGVLRRRFFQATGPAVVVRRCPVTAALAAQTPVLSALPFDSLQQLCSPSLFTASAYPYGDFELSTARRRSEASLPERQPRADDPLVDSIKPVVVLGGATLCHCGGQPADAVLWIVEGSIEMSSVFAERQSQRERAAVALGNNSLFSAAQSPRNRHKMAATGTAPAAAMTHQRPGGATSSEQRGVPSTDAALAAAAARGDRTSPTSLIRASPTVHAATPSSPVLVGYHAHFLPPTQFYTCRVASEAAWGYLIPRRLFIQLTLADPRRALELRDTLLLDRLAAQPPLALDDLLRCFGPMRHHPMPTRLERYVLTSQHHVDTGGRGSPSKGGAHASLGPRVVPASIPKGAALTRVGEPIDAIFVLTSGVVANDDGVTLPRAAGHSEDHAAGVAPSNDASLSPSASVAEVVAVGMGWEWVLSAGGLAVGGPASVATPGWASRWSCRTVVTGYWIPAKELRADLLALPDAVRADCVAVAVKLYDAELRHHKLTTPGAGAKRTAGSSREGAQQRRERPAHEERIVRKSTSVGRSPVRSGSSADSKADSSVDSTELMSNAAGGPPRQSASSPHARRTNSVVVLLDDAESSSNGAHNVSSSSGSDPAAWRQHRRVSCEPTLSRREANRLLEYESVAALSSDAANILAELDARQIVSEEAAMLQLLAGATRTGEGPSVVQSAGGTDKLAKLELPTCPRTEKNGVQSVARVPLEVAAEVRIRMLGSTVEDASRIDSGPASILFPWVARFQPDPTHLESLCTGPHPPSSHTVTSDMDASCAIDIPTAVHMLYHEGTRLVAADANGVAQLAAAPPSRKLAAAAGADPLARHRPNESMRSRHSLPNAHGGGAPPVCPVADVDTRAAWLRQHLQQRQRQQLHTMIRAALMPQPRPPPPALATSPWRASATTGMQQSPRLPRPPTGKQSKLTYRRTLEDMDEAIGKLADGILSDAALTRPSSSCPSAKTDKQRANRRPNSSSSGASRLLDARAS